MRPTDLTKILLDAPTWAPIALTFLRKYSSDKEPDLISAVRMLDQFQRTGRIAVINKDEINNVFVIAKTILFFPNDAEQLSKVLAQFVQTAEIREIPPYTIILSSIPGMGWYLKCEGGNRLLREVFSTLCVEAGRMHDVTITLVSSRKGVAEVRIGGTESNVLDFALYIAESFAVELKM